MFCQQVNRQLLSGSESRVLTILAASKRRGDGLSDHLQEQIRADDSVIKIETQ